MPRNYPHNVETQNFLAEMYDKERTAQMKAWYADRSTTEKPQSGEQPKSRQFQVFSQRIEAACPRPTPALESLRRRRQHPVDQLTDDAERTPTSHIQSSVVVLPPINVSSDMIAPDAQTAGRLYHGTTREGRMSYLRTRHRRRPESRFTFPLVTSWEYGWRLSDLINIEDLHNPVHGRTRVIADTFYRPNGVNSG